MSSRAISVCAWFSTMVSVPATRYRDGKSSAEHANKREDLTRGLRVAGADYLLVLAVNDQGVYETAGPRQY